jgi:hypothetical protein
MTNPIKAVFRLALLGALLAAGLAATSTTAFAQDPAGPDLDAARRPPIDNVSLDGCLNIFSYLTPAQRAQVRAGTSGLDFTPILERAIEAVSTDRGRDGAGVSEICLPPGRYPFASTVDIKHTVVIRGAGGGGGLATDDFATILSFPVNTAGLIVDRYNTLGYATLATPTTGGDGSVIENLAIVSAGGSNPDANGVWLRARAVIRDVNVENFPGNQVRIVATGGSGGATEGNANEWRLDNVNVRSAIGDWGLFVAGGDANAGTATAVGVLDSGGGGICECSFLGNNYDGVHVDGYNHRGQGWVSHGGHLYALINRKAGVGAATTPGSNNGVWYDMGPVEKVQAPPWSAAGTYAVSAAIFSDGLNSRSVFTAPYVEIGGPVSHVSTPAMVIGGNIQTTFTRYTPFVFSAFGVGGFVASPTGFGAFQYLPASAGLGRYSQAFAGYDGLHIEADAARSWRLGLMDKGDLGFVWGNYAVPMILTSDATTQTFGRAGPAPNVVNIGHLALGEGGGARVMTNGAAMPKTSGNAPGEIVFNRAPAPGAPMGWTLTKRGAPDDWRPLAPVGGATTVAGLGKCDAANLGQRSAVSDAAQPSFLGKLVGGGSTVAPAFCNGSAWVAG